MCGVRVAGREGGRRESEKESKVLLGEMSTLLIYALLPPAAPPSRSFPSAIVRGKRQLRRPHEISAKKVGYLEIVGSP